MPVRVISRKVTLAFRVLKAKFKERKAKRPLLKRSLAKKAREKSRQTGKLRPAFEHP